MKLMTTATSRTTSPGNTGALVVPRRELAS